MSYKRTFGEVFPKFMIEVIADEDSDAGFRLLLWDGTEAHIGSSIELQSAPNPHVSQLGRKEMKVG